MSWCLQDQCAQGREGQAEGVVPAVASQRLGAKLLRRVRNLAPAIGLGIAGEEEAVGAGARSAYPVALARKRRQVQDHQDHLCSLLPQVAEDHVLGVVAVDPAKALGVGVPAPQARLL